MKELLKFIYICVKRTQLIDLILILIIFIVYDLSLD